MTRATETILQDELFAIEEGFWLGGRDHFLEHVDERCLLAFPQIGEMHGVRSRVEVAATASSQPGRWRDLKIGDRHLLKPTADTAVISYRANVVRFDGEHYAALVSSAYVKRGDGWKLVFHQHYAVGEPRALVAVECAISAGRWSAEARRRFCQYRRTGHCRIRRQ